MVERKKSPEPSCVLLGNVVGFPMHRAVFYSVLGIGDRQVRRDLPVCL